MRNDLDVKARWKSATVMRKHESVCDHAFELNSASTYRGHVFVKTRYLMLSNAASNTSSVKSLGTKDLELDALDEVEWFDSILAGRLSVSSHGQTTFSRMTGDFRASGVLLRGIYGSNSTSEKVFCNVLKILYSMLIGDSAVNGLTKVK